MSFEHEGDTVPASLLNDLQYLIVKSQFEEAIMKVRYTLALIPLLLIPRISHAQNPPDTVFRFSNRPPADIFSNGFTAAGNNHDLLRFASGASITDQTSAYIPTTSSMAFAMRLFSRFHRHHPDADIYLYSIRPTMNFHSLFVSLQWARHLLPDSPAQLEAQTLLLTIQRADEWVAVERISPEQIVGVQRLRVVNGRVHADALQRNPSYFFLPSIVNVFPLPTYNAVDPEVHVADGIGDMLYLPAAFNNMGCDGAPQNFKSSINGACMPSRKLSIKRLRTNIIATMIASGLLSGNASDEI